MSSSVISPVYTLWSVSDNTSISVRYTCHLLKNLQLRRNFSSHLLDHILQVRGSRNALDCVVGVSLTSLMVKYLPLTKAWPFPVVARTPTPSLRLYFCDRVMMSSPDTSSRSGMLPCTISTKSSSAPSERNVSCTICHDKLECLRSACAREIYDGP